MQIQHREKGAKGIWFVAAEMEHLAEMSYSWAGSDKFIIDHTMVEDELRGQGVGRQLLDAAVAFAREREVKIIPLCPFAKSAFVKDSSLADVWYKAEI